MLASLFSYKNKKNSVESSNTTRQLGLRLSIITQFFPPDYAPTGQLIDDLSRQLRQKGIYVEVFTGQPGYAFDTTNAPSRERREKVLVRRSRITQFWPERIRGKAISGLLFCFRAALHLLKIKVKRNRDIVLLTSAPPFLQVVGYLAHVFLNIPYICLIYDLYPDIAIELGVITPQHPLATLWKQLNKLVWQRAAGIIVLSEAMKLRVSQCASAVTSKITVIHSWADPNWIIPLAKEENWFAERHRLVDCYTVLYSGNMGRCHDIETILEAVKLLRAKPIQFVFIGGGPRRAELINQVAALKLPNCQFLPYQDREVLPYSLTACDLSLVSVSPDMEELIAPSKLYSSLSAGRPIAAICPNNSYLHHLIKAADCGATFANGDGQGLAEFIHSLSLDAQKSKLLGTAGRQYLEAHFTLEIAAEQYLRVLHHSL